MKVSKSTAWWEKEASNHGLLMIDRMAFRDDASWKAVLNSGREEIDNLMRLFTLPQGPELSLLEIGCGIGRLTFNLADKYGNICGLDVSNEFLRIANSNNTFANVQFIKIENERLLTSQASAYDIVFSMEVFHYLELEVLKNYIADAYRLLKPGGIFVFQINTQNFKLRTRLSLGFRAFLNSIGIKYWRDSPTSLDANRKYFTVPFIKDLLIKSRFEDIEVISPDSAGTWFKASKPD